MVPPIGLGQLGSAMRVLPIALGQLGSVKRVASDCTWSARLCDERCLWLQSALRYMRFRVHLDSGVPDSRKPSVGFPGPIPVLTIIWNLQVFLVPWIGGVQELLTSRIFDRGVSDCSRPA